MILLDTHVLLWSLEDEKRVGRAARSIIADAGLSQELAVSAFSFWEIAMLVAKNRISLARPPVGVRAIAVARGVSELPVSGEIGIEAAQLRGFHPVRPIGS